MDAERWLATQRADDARGQWVDPALGRMRFSEWSELWAEGLHDLRDTTRELYLRTLRTRLLPKFGPTELTKVTTANVKAMLADDLADGYSTSAARRHVRILSQVMQAAVDDGRLGRNPCASVRLPGETTRPMRALTGPQVAMLANAIKPDHYRPLVLTAAYVGLRWGELAGLAASSVDPLRQTILVERQLVEVSRGVEFSEPKTDAGVRTVTVPAGIAELLGEYLGSEPVQSSGLAFPNTEGRPLRRAVFRPRWRRTVTGTDQRPGVFYGTELATLTFHELRHTAASLAIQQGAHPLVVKERLGHSSITVTMDRYGHLFPSQDAAVAEALDKVFRESDVAHMWPSEAHMAHIRRSER